MDSLRKPVSEAAAQLFTAPLHFAAGFPVLRTPGCRICSLCISISHNGAENPVFICLHLAAPSAALFSMSHFVVNRRISNFLENQIYTVFTKNEGGFLP